MKKGKKQQQQKGQIFSIREKYQKESYQNVALQLKKQENIFQEFKTFKSQSFTGSTTYIEFHPVFSNQYLVTKSNQVSLYEEENGITKVRNFTKFRLQPYSASFRPGDGKVMIVAGEEGALYLFQSNMHGKITPISLRAIKQAHKSPAHVTRFLKHDSDKVISGSDDHTVKIWDILTSKHIHTFENAHADSIRAAYVFDDQPFTFATGGYDHCVKVWDTRTNTNEFSFDHGAPIESICKHPSAPFLYTAGSNYIKIWDMLRPTEAVKTIYSHQNTITSISMNAETQRLFSFSLDQQFKAYDLASNYSILHSISFSSPLLCGAVSRNEEYLLVGMRAKVMRSKRELSKEEQEKRVEEKLNSENYKFVVNEYLNEYKKDFQEKVVSQKSRMEAIAPFLGMLAEFKFKEALDDALEKCFDKPVVVVSLLEELKSRNNLLSALNARDDTAMLPIIKFILTFIKDYRFTSLLLDFSKVILDIYGQAVGLSKSFDLHLRVLRRRVNEEINLQQQLLHLKGTLDTIMLAASISSQ